MFPVDVHLQYLPTPRRKTVAWVVMHRPAYSVEDDFEDTYSAVQCSLEEDRIAVTRTAITIIITTATIATIIASLTTANMGV